MISPPAAKSPLGPPGRPDQFKATIDSIGAVTLTWTCANPSGAVGTLYQLARRLGPTGEFVHLGTSGKRRFVDATIPAGTASVTYEVRAIRSTKFGIAAQFNVTFGGTPRELTTMSMRHERQLAA